MSHHQPAQAYGMSGRTWSTEPRPSRMGRRTEAPPQTPLQDEPRSPLLTTPTKEEPTGTTAHPADISVQFLDEVPAPPKGEDVPEDQIRATMSRPGLARSAPAQMPAMDAEQNNLQGSVQGNQQDHMQDHLPMHPAVSTPMGPDAAPPLGPVAAAAVLEQPEPRDFPPMQGQYPPPGRDQMLLCEQVNPNEIARQVAAIMMSQQGFQMQVHMPPPMPAQPTVTQHNLYLDPALAGCQPLPMHPHTNLTLNESVPIASSASSDHINKLQEVIEISVHMAKAILEDFSTVCHGGQAGDNDPDSFVKAADPALITAAVTASSVLEVLHVVQEVTGNDLLQAGLREIAASHPATFSWLSSKFREVSTVFPPKMRWGNKFRPYVCMFSEDGFTLARALLYQPRLQILRSRAAAWKQWSSSRALDSQLERLRLDYSMTQSTAALRRSRLQASSIEVANVNPRAANKKRPHESQFREPFPRNRGLADRGRRPEEGQYNRFQRR